MKHPLHSFVTLVQPRLASHDEQHPPEHILDGSKSPSIKSKKIRSGVSTRFLSILKRKRSEKYAQQVYCYGKSWLPSLVASEQDRMDLQHFQTKYVLGGNYLVELDHPEKILDVGTGTGTWLLEMASEFPEATCYGIDIEEHHPTTIIPANCEFIKHDVLRGIPFSDGMFDFLHQRHLQASIPLCEWPKLLDEYHRVCAPGAKIQIMEISFVTRGGGEVCRRVDELYHECMAERGVDVSVANRLAYMLSANVGSCAGMHPRGIPIELARLSAIHTSSDGASSGSIRSSTDGDDTEQFCPWNGDLMRRCSDGDRYIYSINRVKPPTSLGKSYPSKLSKVLADIERREEEEIRELQKLSDDYPGPVPVPRFKDVRPLIIRSSINEDDGLHCKVLLNSKIQILRLCAPMMLHAGLISSMKELDYLLEDFKSEVKRMSPTVDMCIYTATR